MPQSVSDDNPLGEERKRPKLLNLVNNKHSFYVYKEKTNPHPGPLETSGYLVVDDIFGGHTWTSIFRSLESFR